MFVEQMLPRARDRLATIGAGGLVMEAAEPMSKPHSDLIVVCDDDRRMIGVVTKTEFVGKIRQGATGAAASPEWTRS